MRSPLLRRAILVYVGGHLTNLGTSDRANSNIDGRMFVKDTKSKLRFDAGPLDQDLVNLVKKKKEF